MLSKFKKYMFAGGLNEEAFQGIRVDMEEDNRGALRAVSFCGGLVWLAMLLISVFTQPLSGEWFFYLSGTVASFLVWLVSENKNSNALMYSFIALTMLIGMYASVFKAPNEKAVAYIVFLALFPFLFTDRPIRTTGFLWTMYLTFVLCVSGVKSGNVLKADIMNATVFTTFGSLLGTYLQSVRIKHIFYKNEMEFLSNTDTDTELLNRRAYYNMADKYNKEGIPEDLVVIWLDVNGLKEVNDTCGHDAGDKLLLDGTDCIRSVFGGSGRCFRMGGDEFAVVARLSRSELAARIAEFEEAQAKCRREVNEKLSISVGYARADEYEGQDFYTLTKKADEMLYISKEEHYLSLGIRRAYSKKAA